MSLQVEQTDVRTTIREDSTVDGINLITYVYKTPEKPSGAFVKFEVQQNEQRFGCPVTSR